MIYDRDTQETKVQFYDKQRAQFDQERSTFTSHYRDISDYILPRRAKFTISDVNRGDKRNQKIINGTAVIAARTLKAGMVAGLTNPARPWFGLTTPDPDLAQFGRVKEWLHTVNNRMFGVLQRSNIYNVLPLLYGDVGCFGTGAMAILEDQEDIIRAWSFPLMSYWIAQNERGVVDTLIREYRMSVRNIVMKFAQRNPKSGSIMWDNISATVKSQWDAHNYNTMVDVRHIIAPNLQFNPDKLSAKYKRFLSCYHEVGQSVLLRESGFDESPLIVPRWDLSGEDTMGTSCPGMEALGDIKALQYMERKKAKAIDKTIDPPMTAPTSMQNRKSSLLAGDVTYVDTRDGQKAFQPAHEVRYDIGNARADIKEYEARIKEAFYENLFFMVSNMQGVQPRNELELLERKEEKLLALSPVLERLDNEGFDPLIGRVFAICNRRNMFPPAPPEIRDKLLKIDYVSVLAQAQKRVGTANIERFLSFTGNIAQAKPEVADNVDFDETIRIYADHMGVPPKIVRDPEKVAELRDLQAKAAEQQIRNSQLQQAAEGAQLLSKTDTSKDNLLTRLMANQAA